MENKNIEVNDYDGLYEVSNQGALFRIGQIIKRKDGTKVFIKECQIKIKISKDGYCNVSLSKNNKKKTISIHRLVAMHFIPNPENKPEVNHINGIKTDNRAENLEWATKKENGEHAKRIGLIKKGANKSILNWESVCAIREEFETGGISRSQIATKYNLNYRYANLILNYKKWKSEPRVDVAKTPFVWREFAQIKDGRIIKIYTNQSEAARKIGAVSSAISSVLLNKPNHKTVKGFRFVYLDEWQNRKRIRQSSLSGMIKRK